jgi:hypothetical protein
MNTYFAGANASKVSLFIEENYRAHLGKNGLDDIENP